MALTSEYLLCTGETNNAPNVVLLHGWACDREIWRGSLPYLRSWANVLLIDLPGVGTNHAEWAEPSDERLALLNAAIPPESILVGWSLGGMLARELTIQFPGKYKALVTLGANTKFVEDSESSTGTAMPQQTAKAFAEGLAANSAQTLKRFDLLQIQGDAQAKALRRMLRSYRAQQSESAVLNAPVYLNEWLAELYRLDHRQSIHQEASAALPSLHLFGENDSLVPATAAQQLNAETGVLPDCGHLFFLSQTEQTWGKVKDFVQSLPDFSVEANAAEQWDKAAMTRSFSAAATSYDSAAELQRDVADHLFEQCPQPSEGRKFSRVLDLGCGTGYSLPKLQESYGADSMYAMDIASGMLRQASTQSSARLLCGDAENIPLADNSIDLVFSSMALQWCQNPLRWLSEVQRVLAPGGVALVTTVGTESLSELKAAWQQVDQYVHVNQFVCEQLIRESIAKTELNLVSWQEHQQTRYYQSLREITHELKSLGVNNVNRGRPTGLTGRKRMATLIAAYETHREEQGLPVSWQFWTLVLRKAPI